MSTSTNHSQFAWCLIPASSPTRPPFADPVLGQPFFAFEQPAEAFEQPSQSDIDDLMPELCSPDYYTKPTIQELADKERAEPGYCCRVKDFVVGRHGYGSVRFLGETDVRRVDLEFFMKFVGETFISDRGKPPGGQGYNETSEITLLVTKLLREEMFSCNTRERIIRYVEFLKNRMEDQGLEYVSYDPIEGEIKLRVKYFSGLGVILFKVRRESKSSVSRMLRWFADRLCMNYSKL